MSRPDDAMLRAWALPSSSDVSGACDDVSTRLLALAQWHKSGATAWTRVSVHLRGAYNRNHWAVSVIWPGDVEPTIIDNTLAQFRRRGISRSRLIGHRRVFIGTTPEWLATLEILTGCEDIVLDQGGQSYRNALYRELDRNFDPDAVLVRLKPRRPVSEEDKMAFVLGDTHS